MPYWFICYLDLEGQTASKISSEAVRIMRLFSTDTLGFVKDTTNEDSPKSIKRFMGNIGIWKGR